MKTLQPLTPINKTLLDDFAACFKPVKKTYSRGEVIMRLDDDNKSVGILISGTAHLITTTFDGTKTIIDYFEQGTAMQSGLPSVAYFADKACLSPGYFGDMIRKETGLSAKLYIQQHILALSKQLLLDQSQSITQVADLLGFQYPQHFSRFFKKLTGMTPKAYREN